MSDQENEQVETFERDELVRALQARERFLTGAIGSLESFVTLGEDWRLTYANAATERLAGLGADDLVGRDLRDLTPLRILTQALPTLEKAMQERDVVECDASDDERGAVFHVRAYPLADGGLALYTTDVTERVRTERARRESEEALAESEERYRQLFRAESDALLLIDQRSGRVLETNAAAEAMYGYSAEEFRLLTDLELSAEPELTRAATTSVAPGETGTVPLRRHLRKDGSVFPVEVTGRVFDLQGRRVRIAAVRDISERVANEEALRRSEEQYRTIVETAAEGILLGTPEGLLTFVNQRMADMLGYSVEELRGKAGPDFTYDDSVPAVLQARAGLVAGEVVTGEWKARRRDGSLLWTRYNASPIHDEQGRHVANLAMHTDITESKRAEAALRESEERLRHHLENTPLAVVEWDSAFVVTRWAGEAEAMFGWSAAETVGRPMMELGLIHEEDLPIVESTMAKLTDGKNPGVVGANRNVTKDGRIIDCTWFNSVLMDEQGRMTSVMSLVQDNTERRRMEAAVRESQESLNLALSVGGIATWDFRLDTGGVVWNREHFLMLGYGPDEVEPSYEAFVARVHPDDAASVELAFRRSLEAASDYQADFRVVWPDGEVRAISAVGHLEIDASGRPLRQYGVMLDVTERQRGREGRPPRRGGEGGPGGAQPPRPRPARLGDAGPVRRQPEGGGRRRVSRARRGGGAGSRRGRAPPEPRSSGPDAHHAAGAARRPDRGRAAPAVAPQPRGGGGEQGQHGGGPGHRRRAGGPAAGPRGPLPHRAGGPEQRHPARACGPRLGGADAAAGVRPPGRRRRRRRVRPLGHGPQPHRPGVDARARRRDRRPPHGRHGAGPRHARRARLARARDPGAPPRSGGRPPMKWQGLRGSGNVEDRRGMGGRRPGREDLLRSGVAG